MGDIAENTEVIPLNSYHGCLLVKDGKTITRVPVGHSNSISACADVEIKNRSFARSFGDHSLIVLETHSEKKGTLRSQRCSKFVEYKIDMEGHKTILKDPKQICDLQSVASDTSAFEFSSSQQNLMAFLCDIDGTVEVIRFPIKGREEAS